MIIKKIDFSKYSSIKIGGTLELKIAQNLDEAMNLAQNHYLIGKANNILISENVTRIFQLGSEFDYINDSDDLLEIGARTNGRKLFLHAKTHDLGGLEFLGALPGSVGGIVKMNAGMKEYEIKNMLHSVCVNGVWHEANAIDFKYRNSGIEGIISAVKIKKIRGFSGILESAFKQMRLNQPKEPSCGSCFKNPCGILEGEIPLSEIRGKSLANEVSGEILPEIPNAEIPGESPDEILLKSKSQIPAGKLLENVGLRGFKIGNMGFSEKHANFLINYGGGKFEEAIELINLAKQRVFKEFGIKLECEIIILDFTYD
ncbi:UDP-N-acetylenolpyruvoylglucosamine reductase [Helicobacter sp. 16-1353]|uniref:UDP-N-acetylmuramate dehydrogenase n=1 Tax=Helicobacter sp. 16-1353 TaxID=2004996 RepID=UPI000DCB912D|nr:UDP-N-acetylmuramate dehydrogenase [Helicobacter sp. 16-1353]RAX51504.1 UDP-N-acetylenolpyruvoylglucosamine reductase [Helicobacter sp. 16-1353]